MENQNNTEVDLLTWAKDIRIWEKESWNDFVRDLEGLYSLLIQFREFQKWLKETFNNKKISTLSDELKDPARLIVAGGGYEENAFARAMFSLFDVKVAGSDDYETSVGIYERRGDSVRIIVGDKILGLEIEDYERIIQQVEKLIKNFKDAKRPNITEDFKKWIDPTIETPILIEKLNELINRGLSLLEPSNRYVQFLTYFRVATTMIIMEALECTPAQISQLIEIVKPRLYDNQLQPAEFKEDTELIWVINESSPLANVYRLFLDEGDITKLVRGIIGNQQVIKELFGNYWNKKKESIIRLIKEGTWRPLPQIKEAFLDKSKILWIICSRDNIYFGLIIADTEGFKDGVGVDVIPLENQLWNYPPLIRELFLKHRYISRDVVRDYHNYINAYKPDTFISGYTISLILEDIFPLIATRFLEFSGVGYSTLWEYGTFRYILLRPSDCDRYYNLIEELRWENETSS
ncbi:hypothetical protein P8X24_01840 [Pyrococcus kukulkanii]|uniref:hypothetical protein n=1 Tax=Pyrococcus kukulkanii TaxID=1609559 RepID=UPI003561BFF0